MARKLQVFGLLSSAYEIAKKHGFGGTEAEWLLSLKGEQGVRGEAGPQGLKGDKGDTGSQGPQGDAGPQGPKGETGAQGPKGDTGPQGPQGDVGPQGPRGADGTGVTILGSFDSEESLIATHPTGSVGESYLVNGYLYVWSATENMWDNVGNIKGPQGEQGIQGPRGNTGETGPQGEQGPKGDTGDQGIQGPKGDKGDKGDTGEQGPAGQNGKDGTSVTVTSVSESTADGGNNVVTFSDGKTLTVKNGTKGSAGSQGPKGDTGATGPQGPAGSDASVTAASIKTALGYTPANETTVSQLSENKLDRSQLPTALNDALAQAKASGEFKGDPGKTPVKGVDYWTDADQESIVQQVIAALGTPVFGTVDANNIITLTGALADGEYTIKYEDGDGTITEIGTLNTDPGLAYTNWIPKATEVDGVTVYNSTGYKQGVRYSASSGTETTTNASSITISGFIPVNPGDTIRIKNITLKKTSSVANAHHIYCFPTLSMSGGASKDMASVTDWQQAWDSNNQLLQCTIPTSLSVQYIRIQAEYIGADSILTINEPIE